MRVQYYGTDIWTIENFLSPKECEDLILASEYLGFREAEVSFTTGAKMMKSLRNNYRVLYEDTTLALELWHKLKEFCPPSIDNSSPIGLNEMFRFYRYEDNQRFKKHIDGCFKRNDIEESRITFMIYLNEDFEGGETLFENAKITPKIGTALCFIHELKHEGLPVINGAKYVLRTDVIYKIN